MSICVAHLCKAFSKRSETFIYDYVTELERQGVDNHVVANRRVNPDERPFEDVTVVPWPALWNPRRVGYRLPEVLGLAGKLESSWRELWPGAEEEIERIAPDVLHAHFGRPGVKAVPIAEQLNLPLVVTFYGYDISKLPRERRWREAYQSIWETANTIIGISNHICEQLTSLGAPKEKVQKVSLGIDLSTFAYSDPTENFDGQTVRCLHVGRLVEKKAPLHLIRAFHNAVQRLGGERTLRLTIAGGGRLEEDAKRLVSSLGIGKKVSVLGSVSREHVRELMRETHLYTQHCVTASDGDQEGQGVTFVEASATGRPIVSTRHNGIPDVVIHGETGILVEERDIKGMGEAIATLAMAPDKWDAYGKAGRTHVEESFNLSKQTQVQIGTYKRLAESN